MNILDYTAVELSAAIKKGEVTVAQATQAVLDQIEKTEADLNCYVTLDKEGALAQANDIQKKIDAGELSGPLAGVPVAIKDNMCTEGMLTTCSSKILGNFIPTYTAEAVINLQKAGAVILGKTNMDEFAMGSTTETSAFGPTKNPWDTEHVPGGSSGGSAAAVAADECFFALGSDTGGSIRQPASYCGVVGMKPTYGMVSRYGLIAYGSSLDQIGPLAKDVTDCATVLEAIASHDLKDSTSVERETDFTSALVDDVKGMKIGIPRSYFGDGLDADVKEKVLAAAKVLEEKGAIVEEFDLDLVQAGELTPVFFGSALTNFGVEFFLQHFLEMTTTPLPRKADIGLIDPVNHDFSAFVFKIQANMNKAHRDRIAFMRICSGRYDANMEVKHVQGGKVLRLSQPRSLIFFMSEVPTSFFRSRSLFSIQRICSYGRLSIRISTLYSFSRRYFKTSN